MTQNKGKPPKPVVNLIKLCVGIRSPQELIEWEAQLKEKHRQKKSPLEDSHWTRHQPKRAEEILRGGSLYWVINGEIRVRHRILRLDPVTDEKGNAFCAIVYNPKVILVEPWPRRAFQGWRYLEAEDAPPDFKDQSLARKEACAFAQLPEEMAGHLRKLGLL